LLNRAARFLPILRELERSIPVGGTLLEVGSGSLGIGEFWNGCFVGCDIAFSARPVQNMRAVRCCGHQLPFQDGSFDAVIVSDVMEHVSPEHRKQVIVEVVRVARKLIIIGYPCGSAAFELDQKLYRDYQRRNIPPPIWLEEHMSYSFPDEDLIGEVPARWKRKVIPNENLKLHYWMMRAEMFRAWNLFFRTILRAFPKVAEKFLIWANHEPAYRKIFVLMRELGPTDA
jgi:hypothetical protein